MVDLSDPPQGQRLSFTHQELTTGQRQQLARMLTKLTGYQLKIIGGPSATIQRRLVRERRPLWRNRTDQGFEIEGRWYTLVAPDEPALAGIEVTPAAVRRLVAHCSAQLREAAKPDVVLEKWLERGEAFWYGVVQQARERQRVTSPVGDEVIRIEARDVTLKIRDCPDFL